MDNIAQLTTSRTEEDIAKELETIIADLRSGKEKARTMLIVWRDAENDEIGLRVLGYKQPTTYNMGLCTFASHMLYEMRGQTDG